MKEVLNNIYSSWDYEGATKDEIKSAYRSLAKEFHPDKLNGMSQGIKDLAKENFNKFNLLMKI